MGELDSGLLTLLAVAVLALFGVVAFFSLRRHMRRITAPHEAELGAAATAKRQGGSDQAGDAPAAGPAAAEGSPATPPGR